MSKTETPDLQFCNHGSFVSCRAVTGVGWAWMRESVQFDPALSLDGDTIVIEHRYLDEIVHGARADGIVCHG